MPLKTLPIEAFPNITVTLSLPYIYLMLHMLNLKLIAFKEGILWHRLPVRVLDQRIATMIVTPMTFRANSISFFIIILIVVIVKL